MMESGYPSSSSGINPSGATSGSSGLLQKQGVGSSGSGLSSGQPWQQQQQPVGAANVGGRFRRQLGVMGGGYGGLGGYGGVGGYGGLGGYGGYPVGGAEVIVY
jgi:hypothetical protein